MKCRLRDEAYCDDSFQIEFNDLHELEDLKNSLSSMIKYIKICKEDNIEIPELIFRIEKFDSNYKEND